jgi:hypothetical protein
MALAESASATSSWSVASGLDERNAMKRNRPSTDDADPDYD